MSLIALYVYAPTTFTTDTEIETITGAALAAGQIQLLPGIYRLPGDAKLIPANGANGSNYTIVTLNGTKGGFPDPPAPALQQYSLSDIKIFFSGAGESNAV